MEPIEYQSMDVEEYINKTRSGPCFICEMLAGNPDYRHHVVYEDKKIVAFLNKYPTAYGYTLVAPRKHREHVTSDFTLEEYLDFQTGLYRIAEGIRKAISTERLYLVSLGSQQGHRHVHWHLVPLPPGVPYHKQQTEILKLENGILKLSYDEMAAIAQLIHQKILNNAGT